MNARVDGQQEIQELADSLARLEITNAYVYVSYMKPGGHFNPTYSHASDFVATFKAARPQTSVQAWVGLPIQEQWMSGSGYVDLDDATTREAVASFCSDLLRQASFDGVHLDPEPIRSGNTGLLKLLERVREAIGPKTLSIATRRTLPFLSKTSLPVLDLLGWNADYYREIARRVDQVGLMTYDTALPVAALYRVWGRFEVVELTRLMDGVGTELFIGIPTSEEKSWTHWPGAENMESGLQGLVDGLNDSEARPGTVTGVAIYPHWDTDINEWATYESLWLGKR